MKNVLIVEDESIVALEIESYVNMLGYNAVKTVSNAKDCLLYLSQDRVDLILMDVYIKGGVDGVECASNIRNLHQTPIIYISAFSDDNTLERAIKTKPSAYLVKPFDREELKIAIKIAFYKISDSHRVGNVIFDDEFSFDTNSDELILNSNVIHLTKKELVLLNLLVKSKNSVVTLYEMENAIWPDKETNENTRRALIGRLRAKLNYKFLETIHSIGYKLHI